MADTSRFSGKVALVTGGSRGIGFAVAEALVAGGAMVVVSGRDQAALSEAHTRLAALGSGAADRVAIARGDLREESTSERAVRTTIDRFDGLDVLINNAGVGRFEDVATLSGDAWREVIETNLNAVFYCCRAAIPLMRQRGSGWIVNISSLAGSHPFATGAAYCASKAGLDAFTLALMQELRHDDIRVSVVAPGSVGTAFAGGDRHAAAPWKLTATDVARTVIDLLSHETRSLPSRIELRPSKPRK